MLALLLPLLQPLIGKVLDLIPDPGERARQQAALMQAVMEAAAKADLAQLDVNKAEASSGSVFVAGWRPFIGWVCGGALAFQYLARPVVLSVTHAVGMASFDLPGLDDNLWQLLLAMLGMGALRSYDKTQGVAAVRVGK
jgi:hypothetical protein